MTADTTRGPSGPATEETATDTLQPARRPPAAAVPEQAARPPARAGSPRQLAHPRAAASAAVRRFDVPPPAHQPRPGSANRDLSWLTVPAALLALVVITGVVLVVELWRPLTWW